MFPISLLQFTQIVAVLAAPPLLETVNPTLVASNVNIGASPLNATVLREADASAQALSLAGVHNIHSSHASSVLSPPRNTTVGEIQDVEYNVPGTQTTLHMSFREDRRFHRRSLGGYLLLVQDQIEAHINESGDGWLLPQDDPYRRNWQGFYFISKSSPLPVSAGEAHLTYGIMKDALKGFFDIMYLGAPGAGSLPFGCYCNIENAQTDLVGTATIWPAPITIEDS